MSRSSRATTVPKSAASGAQAGLQRHPGARAAWPLDLGRLLEELDEGVLLAEQGHVIGANASIGRMVGCAPEELVGRRIDDLLVGADGRPRGTPAGAEPGGEASRLRTVAGDLVPVTLRPVDDRLTLVVDRSRERRLEGEVWRLSSRLRGLSAEETPEGELFGMIEHEIRTATTVITGYNRMLLDGRVGEINDTQKGFLQETRRATARISSLLDNLLELQALDGPEGLRMTRKGLSLHDVLRGAVRALRPVAEERGLDLCFDLAAECDWVRGDVELLEQVALNLIANACKFSPEGGAVRVRTELRDRDSGTAVVVSVEDAGPGVGAAEQERIFRPFVQGQAAACAGSPGVGLGLAICRKILDAHAGTIEAVAGLGHGLFLFSLPVEYELEPNMEGEGEGRAIA